MRTVVLTVESTIFEALNVLEKENKIELVNIFTEDMKFKHPKHICRMMFLDFSCNKEVLNLIKYYTDEIDFDESIYNRLYKNMFKYMNNISRHNMGFQYVSDTDFIHWFNLIYQFWYGYLKKERIELVIFSDAPHFGFDNILYDLCKEFNIKTLFLCSNVSPLTNTPFLQYAFSEEDAIAYRNLSKKYRDVDEILIEDYKFNHCYMKSVAKMYSNIVELTRHFISKNKVSLFLIRKLVLGIFRKLPMYLEYKECLIKYSKKPVWNENFVYFPLHLQPERTTSVNGGIYCDQVLAVERLSKLIPDDWNIYVKENPKQNEYMRGRIFFKRLHNIKNVKFIDKKVSSSELLKHCKFCASIDGTASFESICAGKPTLIFGNVWWDFLPGVFHYNKNINIEDLLNFKIDKELLKEKYNEYLSKTMIGTLDNLESYQQYCPELSKTQNTINIVSLISDLLKDFYV